MDAVELTMAEIGADPVIVLELPGAGFRLAVMADESMVDESGTPWRNFRRYFAAARFEPGFPALTIKVMQGCGELARVVKSEAKKAGLSVVK